MSGMARWVGMMAFMLVASPTSAEAQSPEANVVRDSAGVRIVEPRVDSRYAVRWALADIPSWTVGELDGDREYLLDRVAGATQLENGTILVANGGTNELRFYDPTGSFVRSEGREGQGPGEFEYLRALGPCRENGFVAFDLNWQMNAYTPDGTFIAKTVFRAPEGASPYNLACDADGHVLLIGWGRDASSAPDVGYYRTYDRLLLTNHDGEVLVDFGRRLVSERIGGRGGSRPHPAGRATRFALHDDHVFVGSGEKFEVEVWDMNNNLLSLLRGPDVDLTVTAAIKSAYLKGRLAAAPEERHPDLRRQVEGWEWPEHLPAYVDMKVDVEGVVWLLAYTPESDAQQRWSLMDPGIGYIGDIVLPRRHSLLDIGVDYLLLLTTDDLDVERVVKLALDRRNAV